MSEDFDPGTYLVESAAPADLFQRAIGRHDQARRSRGPQLLAAAALLTVGGGAGWFGHVLAGAPSTPVAEGPPSVVVAASDRSPAERVAVRLVLHAPEAATVAVAGSFNDWSPESSPLVRAEDGTWHATLQLPRGRYEYLFVVDGSRWVADPTAPATIPDDFGQANAILDV